MKTKLFRVLTAVLLLAAPLARAQVVTTTTDSGAGSLRTVISGAANNATITFAAGLSGQAITLTSGQILLNKRLTIDASALSAGIRINGNHASRIFEVATGATNVLIALTLTNGYAAAGGAILNAGNLTMNRCTIAGNSVTSGGAGGGIYNNLGILTLNQCTIAGNSANVGGGSGGGIFNLSGGAPVTLNQCTVSANSASLGGGFGSFNLGANNVAFFNTIVAGNTASTNPDLTTNTTPVVTGVNLIGGNPLLAPLGNYGGPTPTMPPLSGSPALDAGSYATLSAPYAFATDQRGLPRLSNAHVDIGAVESQALVVTTSSDAGAGSLRLIVAAAPPGSAITFAPSLSGQTIHLTNLVIMLTNTLSIDASALPGGLTLSGGNASQIFQAGAGANVTLVGLTFTAGSAPGSAGGAIYSAPGSSLQIARCTFTGNSALEGGVILNDGLLRIENSTFSGNTGGYGGALQCRNLATLLHCTFSGNSAAYGGGVYNKFTTLTVNNSIIAGNTAGGAGADILSQGAALVFSNANLVQETVEEPGSPPPTGPVPLTSAPSLAPLGSYGGPTQTMLPLAGSPAIDAASLTALTTDQNGFRRVIGAAPDLGAAEFYTTNLTLVVTSNADGGIGSLRRAIAYSHPAATTTITFAANLAGQTIVLTGGQILLERNFILDASALPGGIQINGNHASRLFHVLSNVTAVMNSLSLINGHVRGGDGPAGNDGGNGFPGQGGGIYNAGTLTLNQVTLAGHSAIGGDGGLSSYQFGKGGTGGAGQGGGIYNVGTLALNRCTLAGSSATGGDGGTANGGNSTGGVGQGGGFFNAGSLTLNQTTLAGDAAIGGFGGNTDGGCGPLGVAGNGQGGGIYNAGVLSLNQATVAGDSASGGAICTAPGTGQGGGIYSENTFSIVNSIVAGNSASSATNIAGSFTSTYSLTAGDPLLAPLGNYGGPTLTMPLLPGSPALNRCTNGTPFATDQRGLPRIVGVFADIGAVEGVFDPAIPVGHPIPHLVNGQLSALQLSFTNLSGPSYSVLASTNVAAPFNTWLNLGPAVETLPGSGQYQYTDRQATNSPQRFYRVRFP